MTPEVAADRAVQHALRGRPTLGAGRLVCVDGPSGSGKTTVADAIAARTPAEVVHVDELFPGWDGMALIPTLVERMLRPMVSGRDGHWRRWDWAAGRWAEWHRVRPGGLLVVEGVGAGCRAWATWTSALVWVEAPRGQRLERGHVRNHDMDEHWRRWQVGEDALHVREQTRARADVVVPNRDI